MVLRVLRVILRAVLRDITSVLRVTTRYYEWYYKVLRGTASCTTSDYEVLREVSGTTSGFLEALSWKILQNSLETNCDRVLPLVKLQPYAANFTKKLLHRRCFPMIFKQLWTLTHCWTPFKNWTLNSEAYSEPCQTSKVEIFAKIVNGFCQLTIFSKRSILDVWQGSEYASGMSLRVTTGYEKAENIVNLLN